MSVSTKTTTVCSIPQEEYTPSYSDTFRVRFSPGEFQASLVAVKDIKAGDVICHIVGWIPNTRTRTSFQVLENKHLEFNSDLVFANHSCSPNMFLDVSSQRSEHWIAIALEDIRVGDEVVWFYPSTEWDAWGGASVALRTALGPTKDQRLSVSWSPSLTDPSIVTFGAS